MQGVCEQLKPFNYYSLEQFEYQQLISRSKYFVGSYLNRQTKLNYVVKEIPYQQKSVQILKKIDRLNHNNIVAILGVSLLKTKNGWMEVPRLKGDAPQKKQKMLKQHISLLIFMERYESNLYDYVLLRRKKNLPFSNEEINSFVIQMITLLEALQRDNLAHRDIKPENILCNKGTYLLCDLDDMIEVSSNQRPAIELTTVSYSSPQFLRHIRHPKDKYFDPFKLDVYALGLSLLFMCSMGRFSLQERANYIYQSSERSHFDFIKDQRRKIIRNSSELVSFNSLIKMMLEEDEYKRDDFVTLLRKSEGNGQMQRENSDNNMSDDNSTNSKSSAKLKRKKLKKAMDAKREEYLRVRQCKVYGCLCLGMIVLFVLLCVL